jgi:hypothetical protein
MAGPGSSRQSRRAVHEDEEGTAHVTFARGARNWLKGALGDAIHAVLRGAGHNLRMILRKLRLLRPDSHRFAQRYNRCAVGGIASSERIVRGRLSSIRLM